MLAWDLSRLATLSIRGPQASELTENRSPAHEKTDITGVHRLILPGVTGRDGHSAASDRQMVVNPTAHGL